MLAKANSLGPNDCADSDYLHREESCRTSTFNCPNVPSFNFRMGRESREDINPSFSSTRCRPLRLSSRSSLFPNASTMLTELAIRPQLSAALRSRGTRSSIHRAFRSNGSEIRNGHDRTHVECRDEVTRRAHYKTHATAVGLNRLSENASEALFGINIIDAFLATWYSLWYDLNTK